MGRLDGRVAVITASTRSIGRGIAEAFLAEGAKVMISSRSPEKGLAALAEIDSDDVRFTACDATSRTDVENLIDATAAEFGRLDIAVLNAGGVADTSNVVDFTDKEWQFELDFNLNHCFWGTRSALRHMLPQRYGRIITMSSMYGKIATPGSAGYIANKHAIIGFAKAVASEVGEAGITVNSICPGFIETDMYWDNGPNVVSALGLSGLDELADIMVRPTMIKRPNTVAEVAAMAVLLASEEGGGMTGGSFNVDGGASPF